MAAMRELVVLALDLLGLSLLVAAAWVSWGLGAGLGALGVGMLACAFRLEQVLTARRRSS